VETITARSEMRSGRRFCFWCRQSVVFVYMKFSGTAERKTCLVPRSDEFEGQGQSSKVSRSPGTKTTF